MIIRSQRLTSLSALQKLLELVPLEKEERGASAAAAAVSWASPGAVASQSSMTTLTVAGSDGGWSGCGLRQSRVTFCMSERMPVDGDVMDASDAIDIFVLRTDCTSSGERTSLSRTLIPFQPMINDE